MSVDGCKVEIETRLLTSIEWESFELTHIALFTRKYGKHKIMYVCDSMHFLFRFQLIWVLTNPLPDLPLLGQELWRLLKVVTDSLVFLSCD